MTVNRVLEASKVVENSVTAIEDMTAVVEAGERTLVNVASSSSKLELFEAEYFSPHQCEQFLCVSWGCMRQSVFHSLRRKTR